MRGRTAELGRAWLSWPAFATVLVTLLVWGSSARASETDCGPDTASTNAAGVPRTEAPKATGRDAGHAEPALEVAGAVDETLTLTADGLTLTPDGGQLTKTLAIRRAEAGPTEEILVIVDPPADTTADVATIQLRPDGDGGKNVDAGPSDVRVSLRALEGGDMVRRAEMTVTLPRMGTYSGQIIVSHGDKREKVKLKVVWSERPADFELFDVTGVNATGDWPLGLGGSVTANVAVEVRDMSGRGRTLSVQVADLKRKDADQVDAVSQVDVDVGSARTKTTLPVVLHHAGEYTGTVEAHAKYNGVSASEKSAQKPLTLKVRDSCVVAVGFMVVGLIASFGLQKWGAKLTAYRQRAASLSTQFLAKAATLQVDRSTGERALDLVDRLQEAQLGTEPHARSVKITTLQEHIDAFPEAGKQGFADSADERSAATPTKLPVERWGYQVAALVLGASLAIPLGLKALYWDDPTWGGVPAYIAAIVWGLGLHSASFDGLISLIDKVVSAKGK